MPQSVVCASHMAPNLYIPTIGLEVHAELKTQTKMFCNSKNDPDEKRPNVNVCPICMAHPGTLPTINREAVKCILKIGAAVGGELSNYTEFDRKNYFYPDIPKGYQISQYKYPLVSGGMLNKVALTRVHLEEDTARSSHEGESVSLIDYNRAGVPLMELVTEPVIHSAEEAVAFAKELQLLLRTLEVGEANLEKGEMRIEANISVSKDGKRGTKVEVKNLNSFKAVEQAIKYEITRQSVLIEKGEKVVQETRGWDENKEITFSQRLKEDSHDYRYFPDPDLPKLYLNEIKEFSLGEIKKSLPELPQSKRSRYQALGLKDDDVETIVQNKLLTDFFDEVVSGKEKDFALRAANYLTSDVIGIQTKKGSSHFGKINPANFRQIIEMIFGGELSSRGAKDLLEILYEEGGGVKDQAQKQGLIQVSSTEDLAKLVEKIIAENTRIAEEVRGGKITAIQSLVGLAMKASNGSANPQKLQELFKEKI